VMTRTKVLLLLTCLLLVGCKEKSKEKINSIKSSLPPGTSVAEVESYLKKINCGYSYDSEKKRFTAILRDAGWKAVATQRILIIIKMDERDKLKDLDFMVYYKDP
jgi:hypothetical protein